MHIHTGLPPPAATLKLGCEACGGHWNTTDEPHGCSSAHGKRRHAGDLVNNVFTDSDGRVQTAFRDDMLDLSDAKMTPRNHSVVVHLYPDDLGLQGVFVAHGGQHLTHFSGRDSNLWALERIPYEELSDSILTDLYKKSGESSGAANAAEMATKLRANSIKTGNAGARIMCAAIL
jgi:Cu/Zn superoxide dismutase